MARSSVVTTSIIVETASRHVTGLCRWIVLKSGLDWIKIGSGYMQCRNKRTGIGSGCLLAFFQPGRRRSRFSFENSRSVTSTLRRCSYVLVIASWIHSHQYCFYYCWKIWKKSFEWFIPFCIQTHTHTILFARNNIHNSITNASMYCFPLPPPKTMIILLPQLIVNSLKWKFNLILWTTEATMLVFMPPDLKIFY